MKEINADPSYNKAVEKLDTINDSDYIRAVKRAEEEAAHDRASREYTMKCRIEEGIAEVRAEGRQELFDELSQLSADEILKYLGKSDSYDDDDTLDLTQGGSKGRR